MEIRALKQKHAGLLDKLKGIQSKADKENRQLSDSEQKESDSLYDSIKGLKKDIENRQRIEDLDRMELSSKPVKEDKEFRQFSLGKALSALANQKPLTGREAEVSKEIEKRVGDQYPGQGIHVPLSAIFGRPRAEKRVIDNETALFSDPIMPSETMMALREKALIGMLGLRMVSATGKFHFPKITGSTAGWFSGAGVDMIGGSDPDFESVTSDPKFLGVISSWSLKQLKNMSGDLSLEQLVREDLANGMAEKLNEALIQGTGQNNQPKGLREQADIGKTARANKDPIGWTLKEFLDELKTARTDYKSMENSPKWLISTGVAAELRNQLEFSVNGSKPLLSNGMLVDYPVIVSNFMNPDVPATAAGEIEIFLSLDWSQFAFVTYDSVMIELGFRTGDYEAARSSIRCIGCYDFVLRRKEAFRSIQVDRKA